MDTIKDLFKDLKDRVSSPFFSSFIISWLIFNYTIVIGLVFYKQRELKVDGYKSYLDLINSCWDTRYMLSYPVSVAVVYSLLFKELLQVVQIRITTWSNRLGMWITKTSVVDAEIHRALKKDLNIKIEEYASAIASEEVYKIKNGDLNTQNQSLTANLADVRENHRIFKEENEMYIDRLNLERDKAVNELRDSNSTIEAQYNTLLNANSELTISYNTLKAELNVFSSNNEILKSEIAKIESDLNYVNDSRNGYVRQNDILRRQIGLVPLGSSPDVELSQTTKSTLSSYGNWRPTNITQIFNNEIKALELGTVVYSLFNGLGVVVKIYTEAFNDLEVEFQSHGVMKIGPNDAYLFSVHLNPQPNF